MKVSGIVTLFLILVVILSLGIWLQNNSKEKFGERCSPNYWSGPYPLPAGSYQQSCSCCSYFDLDPKKAGMIGKRLKCEKCRNNKGENISPILQIEKGVKCTDIGNNNGLLFCSQPP